MPRRKRHAEEHENHERWLVSYADFITLLFAFFVVMYAVSSVNEGKYRVLSDSIVSAFRNVRVNASGSEMSMAIRASASVVTPIASIRPTNPRQEAARRAARERLRNAAQELNAALAPLVKAGLVRVSETARGVSVEINATLLFASGDAEVDAAAVNPLRAVAEIIARTDFPIRVEGHTDTTPIATARFPSNWELSAVRASSVVRILADAGMPSARLVATGYGETRPIASNEDGTGRARNRRVTIQIETPDADAEAEPPPTPRQEASAGGPG